MITNPASPASLRKIIGNLPNTACVLIGLGLLPRE